MQILLGPATFVQLSIYFSPHSIDVDIISIAPAPYDIEGGITVERGTMNPIKPNAVDAAVDGSQSKTVELGRRTTIRAKLTGDCDVVSCLVECLMHLRRAAVNTPKVDVALDNLTNKDVQDLAGGMLYFLRVEVTEEYAVKRFVGTYKCIGELEKRVPRVKVRRLE